jgi:hypothetical protein
MAGGQHPGKCAQGVAEEAGGQGRLQPAAVGALGFALTAGQVVLFAASEQVPAVPDQLKAGEQCGQGGVEWPGW